MLPVTHDMPVWPAPAEVGEVGAALAELQAAAIIAAAIAMAPKRRVSLNNSVSPQLLGGDCLNPRYPRRCSDSAFNAVLVVR
jgi:hypothetical protein